MASVTLPAGCTGLDMADGTKYDAPKQGTSIEVSDRHAKYIGTSWYGQTGVMGRTGYSFGTKGTRRCETCNRDWNSWSIDCPRCGRPTTPVENDAA